MQFASALLSFAFALTYLQCGVSAARVRMKHKIAAGASTASTLGGQHLSGSSENATHGTKAEVEWHHGSFYHDYVHNLGHSLTTPTEYDHPHPGLEEEEENADANDAPCSEQFGLDDSRRDFERERTIFDSSWANVVDKVKQFPLAYYATEDLASLAQNNNAEKEWALGIKFMTQLQQTTLSCFKNPSESLTTKTPGVEEMLAVLIPPELDGRDDLIRLMQDRAPDYEKIPRPSSMQDYEKLATVDKFVAHIKDLATMNPILVATAYAMSATGTSILTVDDEKCHDIRNAVYYTYLLHVVGTASLFDGRLGDDKTPFIERFIDMMGARRKELMEHDILDSAFEKMKVATVIVNWAVDRKKSAAPPDFWPLPEGFGLAANIMEAAWQDSRFGRSENAKAGEELMHRPIKLPNQIAIAQDSDGLDLGVTSAHQNISVGVWSNLYSSWNLAFVTGNYPDNINFYAKLLNPVTFGLYQHGDQWKGSYLAARCVTLYSHINWLLEKRMKDKERKDPCWTRSTTQDWSSRTAVTFIWGKVNALAAAQFHERMADQVKDVAWDAPFAKPMNNLNWAWRKMLRSTPHLPYKTAMKDALNEICTSTKDFEKQYQRANRAEVWEYLGFEGTSCNKCISAAIEAQGDFATEASVRDHCLQPDNEDETSLEEDGLEDADEESFYPLTSLEENAAYDNTSPDVTSLEDESSLEENIPEEGAENE